MCVPRWIVLFGGYRQRHTRPNGVLALYKKLNDFRAPGVEMRLCSWDESTSRLASHMALLGARDVLVAGFSYGGWTAVRLCRRLQSHGIHVNRLLLCDPVYRFPCLWPLNALHSLLPSNLVLKRPLRVPDNVDAVYVWMQNTKPPFPSPVIANKRHISIVPRTPHTAMDDLQSWHDAVLVSTAMLLEKP
jgi:pimeloyl-ACP methyl ester carboxylesterase